MEEEEEEAEEAAAMGIGRGFSLSAAGCTKCGQIRFVNLVPWKISIAGGKGRKGTHTQHTPSPNQSQQ